MSPSAISARAIQALDRASFRPTQTIGTGRTASLATRVFIYQDSMNSSFVYVFDWLSAANHVTFAFHRLGDPPPRNGPRVASNDCAIPQSESIIGFPLARPLCPIVLGNTSSDKPKVLEIPKDLSPGDYSVVVSNYGSTSETIRWTILRN